MADKLRQYIRGTVVHKAVKLCDPKMYDELLEIGVSPFNGSNNDYIDAINDFKSRNKSESKLFENDFEFTKGIGSEYTRKNPEQRQSTMTRARLLMKLSMGQFLGILTAKEWVALANQWNLNMCLADGDINNVIMYVQDFGLAAIRSIDANMLGRVEARRRVEAAYKILADANAILNGKYTISSTLDEYMELIDAHEEKTSGGVRGICSIV